MLFHLLRLADIFYCIATSHKARERICGDCDALGTNKIKQTEEVGFNSYEYNFEATVKEKELLDLILKL